MPYTHATAWLLALAPILGFSSCRTHRQAVEEILAAHPEWPETTVAAINRGAIAQGMSTQQVWCAWGRPYRRSSGVTMWGAWESWYYLERASVQFNDGRVSGWTVTR